VNVAPDDADDVGVGKAPEPVLARAKRCIGLAKLEDVVRKLAASTAQL